MPIAIKPVTAATGVISLPPQTQLINPSLLSNAVLIDLGFDPANLPNPFLYPQGMAVSLVDNGSGTAILIPTDISTASNFFGFLVNDTSHTAARTEVAALRGSEVVLFGEAAMAFSTGDQVFLSEVVGRVTNVPPSSSGNTSVRVGFCFSTTKFVLNTDSRVKLR